MGYDVTDIINRSIDISIKKKDIYKKIADENSSIPSIKIISGVLIKNLDKTILYYENLMLHTHNEEIDFYIYDRVSFLINQFNIKTYLLNINNIQDFLTMSLNFEMDIYALLIDIQGRLIKESSDANSETYKILSSMIHNKCQSIEALKKVIR